MSEEDLTFTDIGNAIFFMLTIFGYFLIIKFALFALIKIIKFVM